ncbi:MAG: hypothetical protein ACKOW2_00455 [Sphingobacteriaceae bacterium]
MKTRIDFMLKRGLFIVYGLSLLVIFSCNDSNVSDGISGDMLATGETTTTISTTTQNPFNSTVGAPIEAALGIKWIENFKKTNGGQVKNYMMAVKDLKQILSNTDCIGVCLYFAIDENNNYHILPIGVNTKGVLMKADFFNTQKGTIDWNTAHKWIMNDLGKIDARFFGRNTFNRLFRDASCTQIIAMNALDDRQNPQLLLGNAAIDYLNLSTTLSSQFKLEDASSPCPPICGIFE